MRKHSVRKWIHAVCDLLPLLVIPIFALAVRSDNNFEPISVDVVENIEVDFNQFANNNAEVEDTIATNSIRSITTFQLLENHTYYVSFVNVSLSSTNIAFGGVTQSWGIQNLKLNIVTDTISEKKFFNYTSTEDTAFRSIGIVNRTGSDMVTKQCMITDLTLMFGYGNEPSAENYSLMFSNDYYAYTLSTPVYIEDSLVVYNDTDVGSQMVYTLYNTCDKYFNFNKVGVFQDLYTWFETNVLNGTAPMSFFIVWNVILYEFIMDLIFLTYMVFMFIIDFAECMIDRFFEKSYRGGR